MEFRRRLPCPLPSGSRMKRPLTQARALLSLLVATFLYLLAALLLCILYLILCFVIFAP